MAVNKLTALQAGNVAAFLALFLVNILSNALPLNGKNTGEISDAYPTLFAPAGYVFAIWGVIYILLMVFAVFQAMPAQREKGVVEKVGYLFMLSCAANVLWLFLWHYGQIALSTVAMVVLLVSLIAIYLRLDVGAAKVPRNEKLFVHVPFEVYLGWISVATIANFAAAFVSLDLDGLGMGEVSWTVIMLVVALALTIAMIVKRKDLAFSLVILWAVAGIALKHSDLQPIVLTGAISAIALVAVLATVMVKNRVMKA